MYSCVGCVHLLVNKYQICGQLPVGRRSHALLPLTHQIFQNIL